MQKHCMTHLHSIVHLLFLPKNSKCNGLINSETILAFKNSTIFVDNSLLGGVT